LLPLFLAFIRFYPLMAGQAMAKMEKINFALTIGCYVIKLAGCRVD
jgi:hypothetical protein